MHPPKAEEFCISLLKLHWVKTISWIVSKEHLFLAASFPKHSLPPETADLIFDGFSGFRDEKGKQEREQSKPFEKKKTWCSLRAPRRGAVPQAHGVFVKKPNLSSESSLESAGEVHATFHMGTGKAAWPAG